MQRLLYINIILLILTLTVSGCEKSSRSDKETMISVADSFANAFYNFNYGKAIALCDSDSRKAIYFFCGNLTEKDMEIIRNAPQGASVTVTDADCDEDRSGSVVVTVNDFFSKDSIGVTGTIKKEESYRLPLRKINGRWIVRYTHKEPVEK